MKTVSHFLQQPQKATELFREMIKLYCQKRLLILLGLGFTSGVPFLLTLSTLSFWLTEINVSKTVVGLFMLTSIPYGLKFLWAPLIETIPFPFARRQKDHRNYWGILAQFLMILSIASLGIVNPQETLWLTGLLAFAVSFFAATQDIVIDGIRIRFLKSHQAGAGAAMETIGFRLGMFASGAGALYLASLFSWQIAYFVMAGICSIGMGLLLIIPQDPAPLPAHAVSTSSSRLHRLYRCIFHGWQTLYLQDRFLSIILFIVFFKVADTAMNAMSAPFLYDLGFSKIEYANISKFFGIIMMVGGGLLAGWLICHLSLYQTLVMCLTMQILSCLMFVIQGWVGHDLNVLVLTIGVESFCSGLSATVFIAYLSHFCCQEYAASHFTILYSVGSLCRVVISTLSGSIADHFGWTALFFIAALFTIPAFYFMVQIHRNRASNG